MSKIPLPTISQDVDNSSIEDELAFWHHTDISSSDTNATRKLRNDYRFVYKEQNHKHVMAKSMLNRLSLAYVATIVIICFQGFGISASCLGGTKPFYIAEEVLLAVVGIPIISKIGSLIEAVLQPKK